VKSVCPCFGPTRSNKSQRKLPPETYRLNKLNQLQKHCAGSEGAADHSPGSRRKPKALGAGSGTEKVRGRKAPRGNVRYRVASHDRRSNPDNWIGSATPSEPFFLPVAHPGLSACASTLGCDRRLLQSPQDRRDINLTRCRTPEESRRPHLEAEREANNAGAK